MVTRPLPRKRRPWLLVVVGSLGTVAVVVFLPLIITWAGIHYNRWLEQLAEEQEANRPVETTREWNPEAKAVDILIENPSTRDRLVSKATFEVRHRQKENPLQVCAPLPADRIIFTLDDRHGPDTYSKENLNIWCADRDLARIQCYIEDPWNAHWWYKGRLTLYLDDSKVPDVSDDHWVHVVADEAAIPEQ
mgnify:CR=1 FL=1